MALSEAAMTERAQAALAADDVRVRCLAFAAEMRQAAERAPGPTSVTALLAAYGAEAVASAAGREWADAVRELYGPGVVSAIRRGRLSPLDLRAELSRVAKDGE